MKKHLSGDSVCETIICDKKQCSCMVTLSETSAQSDGVKASSGGFISSRSEVAFIVL